MFELNVAPAMVIRPYTLADAPALYARVERNREHLRRWLPWVDHTNNVRDSEAFISHSLEKLARDDGYDAGIFINGEAAGSIGLHYINRNNFSTEIGYWLAQEFGGQGYMTAAVRAVINHGIATWRLNRVEIRAAATNHRSRAVPERLGFKHEGTLRQNLNLYGTLHDLAVYAVLRPEWAG